VAAHFCITYFDKRKEFVVYTIGVLSRIFATTSPQLDALDNTGISAFKLFLDICEGPQCTAHELHVRESLSRQHSLLALRTKHSAELTGRTSDTSLASWLEEIGQSNQINWIHTSGDTPLLAVLKQSRKRSIRDSFLKQLVERMFDLGANVEVRDRNGDSALVIAARSGSRSVVCLLLQNEANVHVRSYKGIGILIQLNESMASAKATAEGEKLWAMILTCYMALADAGAKVNPSDKDESMLPEARFRMRRRDGSPLVAIQDRRLLTLPEEPSL
jgi:Ankyrin repeats (3 copies)